MPVPNHNRSLGRAAEFERLLAEIFRQAGWRVDRQPKLADGQPDLVARHGGKKYVFELKVSSEGRKDRAVPLISQALLEVRLSARRLPAPAIPLPDLAPPHIPASFATPY